MGDIAIAVFILHKRSCHLLWPLRPNEHGCKNGRADEMQRIVGHDLSKRIRQLQSKPCRLLEILLRQRPSARRRALGLPLSSLQLLWLRAWWRCTQRPRSAPRKWDSTRKYTLWLIVMPDQPQSGQCGKYQMYHSNMYVDFV